MPFGTHQPPDPAASAAATLPRHELFRELTPDRVLEAVDAAGLSPTGLCYPLNSFENRVYEVEITGGALDGPDRVVAKFYRPGRWSREQILEEHRFLAELAAAEVPVVPVRPFPGGATLAAIDGIWYAVWERRGGRAPDELDDATAQRLGRLIGRLHQVGARDSGSGRRPLDATSYVRRPLAWLLEHDALPQPLRQRYAAAARLLAELADRALAGLPVHRIHADLHLGNLLFRGDQLWVVDFDDFTVGPPVQDLWLALPGRDPESLGRRELLLEGYEQFRPFERRSLAAVEVLRGLRMVRYAGWLARRWDDPAFRAGWPYFGTPEYWRGETEDLEAQLAVARGEAEPVATTDDAAPHALGDSETAMAAEGEGLTNRDYFFDWED